MSGKTFRQWIDELKTKNLVNLRFQQVVVDPEFTEDVLTELLEAGLDGNYVYDEYTKICGGYGVRDDGEWGWNNCGPELSNFHRVVKYCSINAMKIFLDNQKIIVNRSNSLGDSILCSAMCRDDAYERVDILIKYGADVNYRGKIRATMSHGFGHPCTPVDGPNALLYAKDAKIAQLLLDHGILMDVESPDKWSTRMKTSAISAIEFGRFDVLKLLVDSGCKKINSQGVKLKDIACANWPDQQRIYDFVDGLNYAL